MVKYSQETETKIKQGAREVFIQAGKDGARMSEIAKRAGVNKALLHYYFRSKDLLFQHVLKDTIQEILTGLMNISTELPFKEFLRSFIHTHIAFAQKHYPIMSFALWEIRKNPDYLKSIIKDIKLELKTDPIAMFQERFQQAILNKEIRPVDPIHFMLNIISLDIFPQLAKPMALLVYDMLPEEYDQLLKERANIVFDLLWNYIKPENQF